MERSSSLFEALRRALLVAALLGCVPLPALAQQAPVGEEQMSTLRLRDPLDGASFEWMVPLSSNGLGGYDSDGCTYARGKQPRTSAVATSPTTLYSALVEEFEQPIPADKQDSLLVLLTGLGSEVDDARKLRPHQRYELAALVAEHLNASPYKIGQLYHSGAWTVRDSIVGFLPGLEGAGDAWEKLAQLAPKSKEVDSDRGRTIMAFDMARLCHRGGFLRERDAYLSGLDSVPEIGLKAKEKRLEFLARVAEEDRLLLAARRWYLVGLNARIGAPSEQAQIRYMVADISRRIGDFDEAQRQLDLVTLDEQASPELRKLAREVERLMKQQQRPGGAK